MRSLFIALSSWLLVAANAQEKLVGEFGQEVLGCRCAGSKTTHGSCGYHFHFMSSEEKPWCRTKFGCGHYSIKGPWVYCDEQGVERRRAEDGKLYNALQFKKFYDKEGRDKWTNAAKYTETRIARNGKAYTAAEFRDYYIDYLGEEGWVKEWSSSKEESRKANDGSFYTFDEFMKHYGKDKAWHMWDTASKLRPDTDSYPKVTFSIGNKIIKTKKGPLHHGSRDPLYNESFNFSVSGDDLGSGTLLVSIMHSRGGGKEDHLVGRVLLGGMMYARGTECEHWTEMMTNPRNMIKYWHKLTS